MIPASPSTTCCVVWIMVGRLPRLAPDICMCGLVATDSAGNPQAQMVCRMSWTEQIGSHICVICVNILQQSLAKAFQVWQAGFDESAVHVLERAGWPLPRVPQRLSGS